MERAKEYISGALGAMLDLGHGHGPMDHCFCYEGKFMERAADAAGEKTAASPESGVRA